MLVIDIAALFIIIGIAIGAVYKIVQVYRQTPQGAARAAEAQGARNADRFEIEDEQRCERCDKAITPALDIFDEGRWWHKTCYAEKDQ